MNDIKDPKKLKDYLLITHAPMIASTIASLKKSELIPSVDATGRKIEDDEYHSPAFHGLMEAVQTFDPNRGSPWTTHAYTRIRGKILDHAKSMHQIPQHLRDEAKAYAKLQVKGLFPKSEGES